MRTVPRVRIRPASPEVREAHEHKEYAVTDNIPRKHPELTEEQDDGAFHKVVIEITRRVRRTSPSFACPNTACAHSPASAAPSSSMADEIARLSTRHKSLWR